MVGMDVFIFKLLPGFRMFRPGTLIFGTLASFFVGLGTLIFHSGFDSFLESLLGTAPFSTLHYLKAYSKEGIAIAAFSIGQDSQILCLVDEFLQSSDNLFEQPLILSPTLQLPDKGVHR